MTKKRRKDYCYCFVCGKAKAKASFSRLSCSNNICNSCSRLHENKLNREVIKTIENLANKRHRWSQSLTPTKGRGRNFPNTQLTVWCKQNTRLVAVLEHIG